MEPRTIYAIDITQEEPTMNSAEIKHEIERTLCETVNNATCLNVQVMEAHDLFVCYITTPTGRTFTFQVEDWAPDTRKRVIDGFHKFIGAYVEFHGYIQITYGGSTYHLNDVDTHVIEVIRAYYTRRILSGELEWAKDDD
jgi:hypothetical protein